MNNMSPENAVSSSAHNYNHYKINFAENDASNRALDEHYAGVNKLGSEAVRLMSITQDATKNGVYDQWSEGKQLMKYQGDSVHEGALVEAALAGVHIDVEQVESQTFIDVRTS